MPSEISTLSPVTLKVTYTESGSRLRKTIYVDDEALVGFNFFYQDSDGRFEERPDGGCPVTHRNNPNYIKVQILTQDTILDCEAQQSIVPAVLRCAGNPGLLNMLNANPPPVITVDTDDFVSADDPNIPGNDGCGVGPTPYFAYDSTDLWSVKITLGNEVFTRAFRMTKRRQ